jgi:hypothetical protein
MTITISERSLSGALSFSGFPGSGRSLRAGVSGLHGTPIDFPPEEVAGSALEPYAGMHIELPDTWLQGIDGLSVPTADLNHLLVEGFSTLTPGEPGSTDWARTLAMNAIEVVYSWHPDMTGLDGAAASVETDHDVQYLYFPGELAYVPILLLIDSGLWDQPLPSTAGLNEREAVPEAAPGPAPTPVKPPSRTAYASVLGWGLLGVGVIGGIWYGIKNMR